MPCHLVVATATDSPTGQAGTRSLGHWVSGLSAWVDTWWRWPMLSVTSSQHIIRRHVGLIPVEIVEALSRIIVVVKSYRNNLIAWLATTGPNLGLAKVRHARSQHSQGCKDPRTPVRFCALWPWPLIIWPQNKWVSRIHGGTFLCQVLAALFFLRYHVTKQTHKRSWNTL